MTGSHHVETFLEMLAVERGAAVNTLDNYRRDLEDFSGFLGARGIDLAKASSADLAAYLSDLTGRGFAASSQARRLSALRQFFRFLYAEGLRSDDPTGTIDSPKRHRPLPKVLSEAEVGRMIDTAKAEVTGDGSPAQRLRAARFYALLEILYATGLRVSELVSLPASAMAAEHRAITVRGKGGKERLVPLSSAARAAMRDYAGLRKELGRGAPSPWLFPSSGESGHVTRQAFARDLKAFGATIGAPFNSSSAMPTSRRRRFTPMCWKSG